MTLTSNNYPPSEHKCQPIIRVILKCRSVNQSNLAAVVSVFTCKEGIVTILPPHLPPETAAALPAGLVEYGESLKKAVIRETCEENGLETEIIQSLGWIFVRYFAGWPGLLLQFMYEARVTGGELRGSDEGKAGIYPPDAFPSIVCPERRGSWNAITTYLARKNITHPESHLCSMSG